MVLGVGPCAVFPQRCRRIFAQVQRYALATLDAPKVVGVNPGPLTLREFAHGVASFFRPLGSNRWGQIAVYR